jgi:hypothetical protein
LHSRVYILGAIDLGLAGLHLNVALRRHVHEITILAIAGLFLPPPYYAI